MSSARTGTAASAAARRRRRAVVGGVVDQRRVGLVPDAPRSRGMRLAATARTTISSLKLQRSSMEPPPRATISRSGRGTRPSASSALKPADRARRSLRPQPSPCTRTGQTMHARREAVVEPMEDVADHRAGRRGHHADDARQIGQLLLALGGEQPLGGELLPPLLEQRHQRAGAGRLDLLDDDLVFRRSAGRSSAAPWR